MLNLSGLRTALTAAHFGACTKKTSWPLIDLANPTRFLALTARVLPWLAAATALAFAVGLYLVWFTAPGRLPAGRRGEDHVHPRAERLARDGRVDRDEHREHRHAGVAPPARRRGGEKRSAARRRVHVPRAAHRLALGPPDVGHLLGLGRAAHLGAGAVPDVSRRDRAVAHRGRSLRAQAAPPRSSRWSAPSTCRSSSSRSTGGTRCISRPRCCASAGPRSIRRFSRRCW